MRWTWVHQLTSGVARGLRRRVVLAPLGWCQVRKERFLRATVTMRSRTPGRARTTPLTPSRREGRVSRLNLWLLTRVLPSLHTRLRVQPAPGFPCALRFRRDDVDAKLGRNQATRMRNAAPIALREIELDCRVGKGANAPCPPSLILLGTEGTLTLCPPYALRSSAGAHAAFAAAPFACVAIASMICGHIGTGSA
jgi:hypothetical protein